MDQVTTLSMDSMATQQASVDDEIATLSAMSYEEVREWLFDKGIPERYCKAFEGSYD